MGLASNDNPTSSTHRRRALGGCDALGRIMAPLTEFHATMADVTNEQHQNMDGLVQADDFNAEIVVRFLRDNGIDAHVDESTGGFRYRPPIPLAQRTCSSPASACAHRSATPGSRPLLRQGKAMISKRSRSSHSQRWNGHRRTAPVEALSARIFRLRIARGYSIYELASEAGILACTIQRLESGKPVDKRFLPPLATALGVPYCQLLCGDHSCAECACVHRVQR